jgi:hypothetical protein
MRKILLTSSQVSVLLSGFIILSCTVALFLSGYAIQQRTLRELRVAVRPRQPRQLRPSYSPKTYLPDQFRTEADGPLVADGQQQEGFVSNDVAAVADSDRSDPVVIEVKQTEPGAADQAPLSSTKTDSADAPPSRDPLAGVSSKKLAIFENIRDHATQKVWAVENPDPEAKSRVPVSRAERRRMIKSEIQKLSQSKERVYYQRRLW